MIIKTAFTKLNNFLKITNCIHYSFSETQLVQNVADLTGILSQKSLSKCTPLMRKILSNNSPSLSQVVTPLVAKPKATSEPSLSEPKVAATRAKTVKALPQDISTLLSQNSLKRCTPLMRRLLLDAQVKDTKQVEIKSAQEIKQQNSATKHNLQNFRHMLANPISNEGDLDKFCHKKNCPIVLDVKYDGQRTLISFQRGIDLEMTSRNSKSQKISYQIIKERIQSQLLQTDIKSIKVDGQIVAVDKNTSQPLPLGELMKSKRVKDSLEDWQLEQEGKQFYVYVFDVVELNGQNLLEKPLIERRKHIPNIQIFKPVEYKVINFPQQRAMIFQFFKDVLLRKYEGLILKGLNDKYYTNESRIHWRKLKRGFINTKDPNIAKLELDLIVMGANNSQKIKNKKQYGSFLVGTYYQGKIIPISNVGTGFIDDTIRLITQYIEQKQLITETVPEEYKMSNIRADVYFKPELVFQIHAQQFTVSPTYNLGRSQYGGLSLRFPSFKHIREDKGPKQATTGQQILQLSKSFNLNLPK